MFYTIPHYYRAFRCSKGACPDTCCGGWEISIDRAALKKYRKKKGPLGARLRNEIDWSRKCFRQYHGQCAFLSEEKLCELYQEGGEDLALCGTCRLYPRHAEEFPNLREFSLSLSCPAAAEQILLSPVPVRFLQGENPNRTETHRFWGFDIPLFTTLKKTRTFLFQTLQDRSRPLYLRTAVVLAFCHDLQERVDRRALNRAEELFVRYRSKDLLEWFSRRLSARNRREELRHQTLARLFGLLDHLEILRDDWLPYFSGAKAALQSQCASSVQSREAFRKFFTDAMTEQLLIYFLFTYFYGAIYNGSPYGKAKLAFAGTVLIRELAMAYWLKAQAPVRGSAPDAPQTVSLRIALEAAWKFSRELEHSDFNLYRLEALLEDEERFGLEALFSLFPT